MNQDTKDKIEVVIKRTVILSAILWVLYIAYEQLLWARTGFADPICFPIIEIGGTIITSIFWFYLVPKFSIMFTRNVIARIRHVI